MILVFCELKDGKIRKASLEALSEARRLAGDSQVGAIFAGASCAGAENAAKYGADVILKAEAPALGAYSSDLFAAVVAEAVKTVLAWLALQPGPALSQQATWVRLPQVPR